ncbi:MAG: hypothetical protein KC420_09530, partial [Myxococcales bacterium]|nr:hypothetical protein [Myxococcales bacterium]
MATWTRGSGRSGWRAHRGRRVRLAALASLLGLTACTGGIEAPADTTPGGDLVAEPALVRGESPITLRGEDGTPLRLREVAYRGQLDAFFGATEVEMTFENPEGRSLDGRLSIALPADARLVRFAVLEGGAWREAEVVPRKAAFDSLLRDVREPALIADGGG